MRRLQGLKRRILCLAFSPDGRTLMATCERAMQLGRWDLPAGTFRRWHPYIDDWATCVAYSPNGKYLAVGGYVGLVLPYIVARERYNTEIHANGAVQAVAFAPKRAIVATASIGGLLLSDLEEGHPKDWEQALDEFNTYLAVAFSPDGKFLAAGAQGMVCLWELSKRLEPRTMHEMPVVWRHYRSVAFAPDSQTLAVAGGSNVYLHDLAPPWSARAVLRGHKGRIHQIAYHPAGRILASAGSDGTVRFWDAASGSLLQAYDWGIGKVGAVAFAPDGMTCVAGGEKGGVVLWDVEEG